jgi:hypothetical protein
MKPGHARIAVNAAGLVWQAFSRPESGGTMALAALRR